MRTYNGSPPYRQFIKKAPIATIPIYHSLQDEHEKKVDEYVSKNESEFFGKKRRHEEYQHQLRQQLELDIERQRHDMYEQHQYQRQNDREYMLTPGPVKTIRDPLTQKRMNPRRDPFEP